MLYFRTLSMEKVRLLMHMCPNAFVAHDIPMMHLMRLLMFHSYMERGFQKSMQFFVAYGYCVFGHDIFVDLPDVLDRKPDYANVPLSEFLDKACVDQPEVLDEKPEYFKLFFYFDFPSSFLVLFGLWWFCSGLTSNVCSSISGRFMAMEL